MFLIIVRHGRCDYPILGVRTGDLESGQRGQAKGTEPAGTELGICGDRKALLSAKFLLTSSPPPHCHSSDTTIVLWPFCWETSAGEKHFPRSGQTRKHISHPGTVVGHFPTGWEAKRKEGEFLFTQRDRSGPRPERLKRGFGEDRNTRDEVPIYTHTERERVGDFPVP